MGVGDVSRRPRRDCSYAVQALFAYRSHRARQDVVAPGMRQRGADRARGEAPKKRESPPCLHSALFIPGIRGSARDAAPAGLTIIGAGEEVRTTTGDLIALYVNQPIRPVGARRPGGRGRRRAGRRGRPGPPVRPPSARAPDARAGRASSSASSRRSTTSKRGTRASSPATVTAGPPNSPRNMAWPAWQRPMRTRSWKSASRTRSSMARSTPWSSFAPPWPPARAS